MSDDGHGTGYAETEALMDALDGDEVAARRVLVKMSRMERERLLDAMDRLHDIIDDLG